MIIVITLIVIAIGHRGIVEPLISRSFKVVDNKENINIFQDNMRTKSNIIEIIFPSHSTSIKSYIKPKREGYEYMNIYTISSPEKPITVTVDYFLLEESLKSVLEEYNIPTSIYINKILFNPSSSDYITELCNYLHTH